MNHSRGRRANEAQAIAAIQLPFDLPAEAANFLSGAFEKFKLSQSPAFFPMPLPATESIEYDVKYSRD